MVGVLEVMFGDAHVFEDREVRTYRLMAGLLGEAMSHTGPLEQKEAVAAEPPAIQQRVEMIAPQPRQVLNNCASKSGPTNNPATHHACGAAGNVLRSVHNH
ncbi:MAG TPA: hypothetical protein VLL05_01530 [Terriglobales bacterium]|nr:hypothetical protein [Terriglobales bacterium]